jgi:hypothetical protein
MRFTHGANTLHVAEGCWLEPGNFFGVEVKCSHPAQQKIRRLRSLLGHRAQFGGRRSWPREVLEEFMIMFRGVAAQYQPLLASGERNPNFDADQFERWAVHACDTAKSLAPYQSPQLKAVGINLEMARRRAMNDDDEPVRYPTVKEIRRELALRGLPPLQHIIEAEIDEDGTYTVDPLGHNP